MCGTVLSDSKYRILLRLCLVGDSRYGRSRDKTIDLRSRNHFAYRGDGSCIDETFYSPPAAASVLGTTLSHAHAATDDADRVAVLTENLNPQIQHARDVALAILKPSAAELERGLRLHAESIVFDSYGFSPRAAIDGDLLAATIEAGASPQEIEDLQEDITMTRYVTDPAEQQEYRSAWQASGVTCIFQNAGQECQDPLRLIKRLARFNFATDLMRDFVAKAAVPADVEAAKAAGRHALYMTGNGIPLTQEWNTKEDELAYVKIFFQLGIRMMHLTYQRRNMIGDGCGETSNAGLSDFGRTAIAEMNRIGVIPDCAHSGWQTSLEAAKVSTRPVVASHSTCAAIHPHIRSKPDDVIRAIVDSGGYIGICCISKFLRGGRRYLLAAGSHSICDKELRRGARGHRNGRGVLIAELCIRESQAAEASSIT